jgi:hypothetical protein
VENVAGSAKLVTAALAAALVAAAPAGELAVRTTNGWHAWWQTERAPARWTDALPVVRDAVTWQRVDSSLEVGELRLSGPGEAWRVRVILVRLDPRAYELRLAANVGSDGVGRPWTVATAPAAARVALNAGQFTDDGPWGWVVHHGRELRPPGDGPLAMAVVVDTLGVVRLVEAERVAEVRAQGGIAEAFQSYPALLVGDGDVPLPLRERGRGVDLEHRDARLAIGELRDGRLLVALTRFDALGGSLAALPFGPTVREMAAIMGALGCARAVALDGGISGQLLVRERDGNTRTWPGLRAVPLGLAILPGTTKP